MAQYRHFLLVTAWGLCALGLLGQAGCGARSAFPDLEPCYHEGASRKCQDPCGSGRQFCNAGYWRGCVSTPVTEACSNNCGSGNRTCSEGVWSDCNVPESTRDCKDNCGSGTQVCRNNEWKPCEVPETRRTCANSCGTGTQVCSNDEWSVCDVADTTQACTNECGTGEKACKKNTWSECQVAHAEKSCSSVCGAGKQTCDNGIWSGCDAPQPLPPKLHAVIRDFRYQQPIDFGHPEVTSTVDDRKMVQPLLGSDDTPVYALSGSSLTVQSAQTFAQWYHDVPGVNQSLEVDLPLTAAADRPGLFVYENHSFFPIDNKLFGNEGRSHNYYFTLAAASTFTYLGNEVFTFDGDDDVFVFINRHLAIDLGGLHEAELATVNLAAHANEFGLVVGNRYPIHIFFAERHAVASDFLVETSIADIGSCP